MSTNQDFANAASRAIAPGVVFDSDLDFAPIAPILAGARARGVADALEMLGIAAILIAADGDVLFANEQARALLVPHLTLSGERLFTANEGDQRALARMIKTAVAGPNAKASSLVLRRGAGVPALHLHATPIASDDDPFQLLKAVIVLDRKPGRSAD